MVKDLARQAVAGLRILLVFTVITGVVYPLAVWGVGKAFGDRTDGRPVMLNGQVVGSVLLGQNFKGAEWFHSRPSANDYDTLASAPTNLGPSNPDLITSIKERRAAVAKENGVAPSAVPADAITASGSGLDPQISPAYAALQVQRVAEANGLSVSAVKAMVADATQGRALGFLGEPTVNVLQLNLGLDKGR